MTADQPNGGQPTPAPRVDLMETLGLRIRVSFPDFLALPASDAAAPDQPASS